MSAHGAAPRAGQRMRGWALSALIAAAVAALAVSALSQPPPTAEPARADPSDAEQVGRGRLVYANFCAKCHGANLEGAPNWRVPLADGSMPAPPHDASGTTWRLSDQELFAIVRDGGPSGRASVMPGFGGVLRDREIWAVIAYIKSSWPEELRDRQGRAAP